MNIKLLNTREEWNHWDDFVLNLKYASFLSYSFWLDTYILVPFVVRKICFISIVNGEIQGGIAGLQIGYWPFKITVFPSGPFFQESTTKSDKEFFLRYVLDYRQIKNSKIIQLSLRETLDFQKNELVFGRLFKKLYADPGVGCVELKETPIEQLESLKYKVSRYIKAALRRGLELKVVSKPEDLTTVYDQLRLNAEENKYKIRPYWMYKSTWEKTLKSGKSIFLIVYYNNQAKGSAWLIDSGKMLNYIMGGSSKEKPRLDVGYFIHWSAMQIAIEKGYKVYNISIGGSPSVEMFKDDFGRVITLKTIHQFKS